MKYSMIVSTFCFHIVYIEFQLCFIRLPVMFANMQIFHRGKLFEINLQV